MGITEENGQGKGACCARTATGHAAALPRAAINFRRFIQSPSSEQRRCCKITNPQCTLRRLLHGGKAASTMTAVGSLPTRALQQAPWSGCSNNTRWKL
jgi:hypothetical protein